MGSSFHNFGAATLIGLSLNTEKDLPLKNTSKHATGSIELKLNLVARQGHWEAWKETTVVICYDNNNGICGNIFTLRIIYRFSHGQNKVKPIKFNLWKSRNLHLTDFKTKKEHYRSIISITLIVLEKSSYPYVSYVYITNTPPALMFYNGWLSFAKLWLRAVC